ncbi:MAG: putative RNase H-like HicB family nuclease [Myxococcota bacterium]|jgi:predicted RNase H-like HicB family nuclease
MAIYHAGVFKEDDSQYGAVFHDFPGTLGVGATMQDCFESAREALRAAVETMRDLGMPVPEPSGLDVAQANPDLAAAVTFIGVHIETGQHKREPVRINVTIDKQLLERADMFRKGRGLKRSALFELALRAMMKEQNESGRPR